MDAASAEASRGNSAKVRQLRWSSGSMSQRLEEIVAQLMRPIRDLKQNFQCDISLLEEYLTEVGLRHLDGKPEDFATIAMLVQQCAAIYSKKVDFYEQSVYDMIDRTRSTASSSQEARAAETDIAETPSGRRRKRRISEACRDFASIHLEPAPNITREMETVRPPPTLPKSYIEFERSPITERDARLTDYQGNEIGVVNDFHVNWNLKDGLLVDDLDSSAAISRDMVRPIITAVLDELRRLTPLNSGSDSGIECSALDQQDDNYIPPQETVLPSAEETVCKEVTNKRKANSVPNLLNKKRKSGVELRRTRVLEKWWKEVQRLKGDQGCFEGEFVLDVLEPKLLEGARGRCYRSLLTRGLRMLATDSKSDFLGFSHGSSQDCESGMRGFTEKEHRESQERRVSWLTHLPAEFHPAGARGRGASVSDDDGFFDSSSHGGCDLSAELSQTELRPTYAQTSTDREELTSRVEEWHALVGPRVAAAERAPPFDARAYSADVLRRLPAERAEPFARLVRGAEQHDVCRVFLATLFLANTGNVELCQAAPLAVDTLQVRLRTANPALYMNVNPME